MLCLTALGTKREDDGCQVWWLVALPTNMDVYKSCMVVSQEVLASNFHKMTLRTAGLRSDFCKENNAKVSKDSEVARLTVLLGMKHAETFQDCGVTSFFGHAFNIFVGVDSGLKKAYPKCRILLAWHHQISYCSHGHFPRPLLIESCKSFYEIDRGPSAMRTPMTWCTAAAGTAVDLLSGEEFWMFSVVGERYPLGQAGSWRCRYQGAREFTSESTS